MNDVIKIKNGTKELEVTQKAFEVVYKGLGYSIAGSRKKTSTKG